MRFFFMIAIGAALLGQSQAAQIRIQSGPTQTSLLELYTSEGCSSCPPAETWLSRLKNSPELWTNFVPIAFHVDYWDDLGWRDPWSARKFTDRQQAYAQTWAPDSIYTPEFVLNGGEWLDWRRSKTAPVTTIKAGILTAVSTNGWNWKVTYQPITPQGGYNIHAALLVSELSSDVKAGENSGRRLNHDFVAVTLVKKPLASYGREFRGTFEAIPPKKKLEGRTALAVWVTETNKLKPLQATGGWLP